MHQRTQEGISRLVLQDRPTEDLAHTRLPTALLPLFLLTIPKRAQDHQDEEILHRLTITVAVETVAIQLISKKEGKSDLLLKLNATIGERILGQCR